MSQQDFDQTKIKKVKITSLVPNTWNPKLPNTPEYEDVKESIFQIGLRGTIVVRKHPTLKGKYEIIDGQQRWTAATELGYEEVWIYDEGEVSDKEAKELTIWWQQRVPFDPAAEAILVTNMVVLYDEIELPYTDKEIEAFKNMVTPSEADVNKAVEEQLGNARTLKVVLAQDAYEIIMRAVHEIMLEHDCNEGRALELICADYLA